MSNADFDNKKPQVAEQPAEEQKQTTRTPKQAAEKQEQTAQPKALKQPAEQKAIDLEVNIIDSGKTVEVIRMESGYNDEDGTYNFSGITLKEGAIFWMEFERITSEGCEDPVPYRIDLDILEKMSGVRFQPIDCNMQVTGGEDAIDLRFPADQMYINALRVAKLQRGCGIIVICADGEFKMPCQSFYLVSTGETVYIPVMFNSVGAISTHHRATGIKFDVGAMTIYTAVRYVPGKVYDWQDRYQAEINYYRKRDPDYDPEGDPNKSPDDDDFGWMFD